MYMNEKHPKYNQAMELLCSLPRFGCWVTLKDLCDDLELKGQDAVRRLMDHLKGRGVEVSTFNVEGHGRCAAITRPSWDMAKILGTEYWKEVYAA